MTQKERWDKMVSEASADTLEENVRRFFSILDIREESEVGRIFAPVFISSVRVEQSAKLNEILKAMKRQSGYEQ